MPWDSWRIILVSFGEGMESLTEILDRVIAAMGLMEDNFGKFWRGNGKFKVILDRVINAMRVMDDNFGKSW